MLCVCAAKKDYLKDLQQYRVQNAEPEIEGAAGMMRTGSDGCLSNNIDNSADVGLGRGWPYGVLGVMGGGGGGGL